MPAGSVDHDGDACVKVAAKVNVAASVARFRIRDDNVAVVHVSGRGCSRLVTPEATALVAIPVVVKTGIYDERHEPPGILFLWQAVTTLLEAIGHGGRCDCRARHGSGLGAVCPSRLSEGVSAPVASVVVAIVV